MADWDEVRATLTRHKQEHLLRFLPELSDREKAELCADIREIDFPKIENYFSKAERDLSNCEEKKDELLQPLDSSICGSTARDKAQAKRWEEIGALCALAPPLRRGGSVCPCRYGAGG